MPKDELTIHIGYKRTFQIKPYESQVIEFSVSGNDIASVLKQCTPTQLQSMATAYTEMETTGNQIIAKALEEITPKQPNTANFEVLKSRQR